MKSFAKFAAFGMGGLVVFKLATALLFPIMALMMGLLGLALKIAVIAAIGYFLYGLFKKSDEDEPNADGEIVVEPDD